MAEIIRFDERVAIVTGAGGGLGRAHALALAQRGALVVVNDLGGSVQGQDINQAAAQKVVDEITAAGGKAMANSDNIATTQGAQALVDATLKAFGRVDILVNNAGINTSGISVDGYDLCYQSNFLGHFLLTNLLIKKLMKAENVTSDGRRGKYYQGDIFIP